MISMRLTDSKGKPADKLEELARGIDLTIFNEIPQMQEQSFPPLKDQEMKDVLHKTSNFPLLDQDNISWFWLKQIVSDKHRCTMIIRTQNTE